MRVMSWLWLWCGLLGIIVGACLLGAADASKPKSSSSDSYFGSYASSLNAAISQTYALLVAFGVILLVGGE